MKKKISTYLNTLAEKKTQVYYEPPTDHLYIFKGFMADNEKKEVENKTLTKSDFKKVYEEYKQNNFEVHSLDINKSHIDESNLLLRGSVLRNTDFIIGMVMYSGSDTKIMLNSLPSKPKWSKLEEQLNR
jgi:magnesium-transporting ATPase (P-type)